MTSADETQFQELAISQALAATNPKGKNDEQQI